MNLFTNLTFKEELLELQSFCYLFNEIVYHQMGTVAHEFTHALGFWHTQMRSDRNTYVTVNLANIEVHSNIL